MPRMVRIDGVKTPPKVPSPTGLAPFDADDAVVVGARVRSDGVDYSGRASATTDAAGNFTVAMRRGGRALVEASVDDGRVSNAVTAGPSDTAISLPVCLVLGNGAPVFVVQPQPQATAEGSFVVFQALARGQAVLRYQWQRNGVDIPGATATTLLVDPVGLSDNGVLYRAVASNAVGTATSQAAALTVAALPPLILAPPQDLTVLAGASASFSLSGSGALSCTSASRKPEAVTTNFSVSGWIGRTWVRSRI